MNICNKCGANFPNRLEINGKRRNLSKRSYCLICSPFGAHNTRPLTSEFPKSGDISNCKFCNKQFTYLRNKGYKRFVCNSCVVNRRRFSRKERAIKYLGGKCIICNYDKCARALTFHHKDPSKKDFGLSGNHCRKWELVQIELDKCVLLCQNCHSEEHDNLDRASLAANGM